MPELVLYGIRELAEQFLGPLLDIEVENSGLFVVTHQLHDSANCMDSLLGIHHCQLVL